MENHWRSSRWISSIVTSARDRQISCGVPLSTLRNFAQTTTVQESESRKISSPEPSLCQNFTNSTPVDRSSRLTHRGTSPLPSVPGCQILLSTESADLLPEDISDIGYHSDQSSDKLALSQYHLTDTNVSPGSSSTASFPPNHQSPDGRKVGKQISQPLPSFEHIMESGRKHFNISNKLLERSSSDRAHLSPDYSFLKINTRRGRNGSIIQDDRDIQDSCRQYVEALTMNLAEEKQDYTLNTNASGAKLPTENDDIVLEYMSHGEQIDSEKSIMAKPMFSHVHQEFWTRSMDDYSSQPCGSGGILESVSDVTLKNRFSTYHRSMSHNTVENAAPNEIRSDTEGLKNRKRKPKLQPALTFAANRRPESQVSSSSSEESAKNILANCLTMKNGSTSSLPTNILAGDIPGSTSTPQHGILRIFAAYPCGLAQGASVRVSSEVL